MDLALRNHNRTFQFYVKPTSLLLLFILSIILLDPPFGEALDSKASSLNAAQTFVDFAEGVGSFTALATSTGISPLAPSASAFTAPPTSILGWTKRDGDRDWIGSFVSVGDAGRNLFTFYDLNNTGAALYPVINSRPPLPTWEVLSNPALLDLPHGTAAAKLDDSYVAITEVPDLTHPGARAVDIRRYSKQLGEEWTYRYPHLTTASTSTSSSHIAISDDGRTIVATALDSATSTVEVLVFEPSGTIQAVYQFSGSILWSADLSADGLVLALALDTRLVIIETASGFVRHDFNLYFQLAGSGIAISGDGARVAYGTSSYWQAVQLMEWDGSQYNDSYQKVSPVGGTYRTLEFSIDGKRLGAGIGLAYPSATCRVELINADTGSLITGETVRSSHGPNMYQNTVMDLAISADGSRLAAALFGDEEVGNTYEEIRVYDSARGLIRVKNLPGSAFSVDISLDGRVVAVGSKAVHANELGRGGQIDLIYVP